MHIAIDESGSFVYTTQEDSWNCVLAYVYPESNRRSLSQTTEALKRRIGSHGNAEVKLNILAEEDYLFFLDGLSRLDGVLYAVATDASINTPDVIDEHQREQVRKILAPVDLMNYESGRQAVRDLARQFEQLPAQLYVQMVTQVELALSIINSAILYFVQRFPQTLRRFRWRIDQKSSERTQYEQAFLHILPGFLQSASLKDPMPMLEGANYRAFDRFYFPTGEEPTYLRDTYGIELDDDVGDGRKLNIGKMIREDIEFVDSCSSLGVQVADLLASGLRRCLRQGFSRNRDVAAGLGRLMVQAAGRQVPVRLVAFGIEERLVGGQLRETIEIMDMCTRPMVRR